MNELKSFDDFVNENLVAKGEYNFYGPGSLMPIVQKLLSEGKGESVIRTYLYSIGVAPWRIEKVFNEMNLPEISLEKKINEGKKMTFEEKATKFLETLNEEGEEISEASKWKGKEIYPNWVKPSDIGEFIKRPTDLVVGKEYVLLDLGMDVWQADYEYIGKVGPMHQFKVTDQFAGDTEPIEYTDKELKDAIKDKEIAVMESEELSEKALINKKPKRTIRAHSKVKPGNVATDYNDDAYTVVGVGTVADLADFDDSGAAEELDPNEEAIAVLGRGGYAVYSYDPDGAVVYEDEGVNEAKKKTFEEAAAAFLLGLQGSDAINDNEDDKVEEKLNKKTLQVEEGDGEDIDDMIDDLADGDEDEYQGADDNAPDSEDEKKIKDGDSAEDAVDSAMDDATDKIKNAAEELAKDSKKLAKIKKILGESKITEDITRMLNDGAMSEIHLLAKEAKDEKDFMAKAKKFVEDMGVKFEKGMETMMKAFWNDMKNESVREAKTAEIEADGDEVELKVSLDDEETGDEIEIEEESVSNPYIDAVTEGLKHRFRK